MEEEKQRIKIEELTPREKKVLMFILKVNSNNALKNKKISPALMNYLRGMIKLFENEGLIGKELVS